ncbi:hypothetical protein MMC13_003177 [Lambiella insularis]|nr:hypothetical protein [Lambiella insularis]
MVQWRKLFSTADRDTHHFRDEMSRLLPVGDSEAIHSAYPPAEVTKVALRLKYQIEQVIPCELEEWKITKANSPVITRKVALTAKEAGGKEYRSCVVYCLLVCKRWFMRQALLELWDADLHNVRAVACEVLAKKLIEDEEREDFLMQETLLKRYSIIVNGQETDAANVIERAVDLHALLVIGSSGYQKCISYLWRGLLVQNDEKPSYFIAWKDKANTDYWTHFNPDRMRAPIYQNAVQIFFSLFYLALYSVAINTVNSTGDLDVVEGIVYLMTAAFMFDEIAKIWKDNTRHPLYRILERFQLGGQPPNTHDEQSLQAASQTLYALLTVSFVTRMIALGNPVDHPERAKYNEFSYNFLAFTAPMFWLRLLLYLDTFRFFGAMLVVLKVMMKESLIFFALLVVVCIGFLQAFIGLNQVEGTSKVTSFIVQAMTNSVMQSPDFSGFDNFAPPFGLVLYYIYTFVVMVILLNILIALFNSAYEAVTDNSIDEWMALFATKTMQFVRAPDENVFIPPFNLIEIFCLILPFEWWMQAESYERLNNFVMGVLYSPLLLITAYVETRHAHAVIHNRRNDKPDDDTVEEWEHQPADGNEDFETDGWAKAVESTKPNVETDAAVLEIRELKQRVEEIIKVVEGMKDKTNGSGA